MFIKKTNVLVCRLKGRIIGDGAVKDKRYEKHMIKLMFNCQKDLQLTLIIGRNNIRKTFIYIIVEKIYMTQYKIQGKLGDGKSKYLYNIRLEIIYYKKFYK